MHVATDLVNSLRGNALSAVGLWSQNSIDKIDLVCAHLKRAASHDRRIT